MGMVPIASNSAPADNPADHMSRHRGRMRTKLLDRRSEAISKLELLEMLLSAGNRRGDTKPLAEALILVHNRPSGENESRACRHQNDSGTKDSVVSGDDHAPRSVDRRR